MPIEQHLIFWPVVGQVLLTISMFFVLAARKAKAVKAGEEDRSRAALDNKAWNDDVVKVSNNIDNQFQTPVLFYAVCIGLFSLNGVSMISLILAWGYLISRCLHAHIHIGTNHIPHRLPVFVLGLVMLLLLVVCLVARLLSL